MRRAQAVAANSAAPPAATGLHELPVAKTYAPTQNGAKRYALRYGGQLICVRHRLDAAGTTRYTTIELLVEQTPVASRARTMVALRLPPTDRNTRRLLIACGGQWMPAEKCWAIQRGVAKRLRLLRFVVPTMR